MADSAGLRRLTPGAIYHRLGSLLPRRSERRAERARGQAAAVTPTSYRTFSRKLAPSLTALGGALALGGGLGTWIRATEQGAGEVAPREVAAMMGYEDPIGRVIAVAGGLALLASVIWLTKWTILKIFPALVAAVGAGLIAYRLPQLQDRIHALTENARQGTTLEFEAFHAGLGWGGWLAIIGAVLLVLGAFVGVLRELDVRRGIPDET